MEERKQRHILRYVLLLLVLAAAGAWYWQSHTTGPEPTPVVTTPGAPNLTIGMLTTIDTLDPEFAMMPAEIEIIENLYGTWTAAAVSQGTESRTVSVPMLLESLGWSEDWNALTVKLRPGLTFSATGNPVTADDLYYTLERGLALNGNSRVLLSTLGFTSMEQAAVVDDLTLNLSLPEGAARNDTVLQSVSFTVLDSVFLQGIATQSDPYCREYLKKNCAGAGPYQLTSWKPGEQMVLSARETWAGQAIPHETVTILVAADSTTLCEKLLLGDVDIARDLSAEDLLKVEATEGYRVRSGRTMNTLTFGLNMELWPLQEENLRKALASAVPYDRIVEEVYAGHAEKSKSLLPSLCEGFTSLGLNYFGMSSYNMAAAGAWFGNSGYEDWPLELTIAVMYGDTASIRTAALLEESFESLGFQIQVDVQPAAIFARGLANGTHEAYIMQTVHESSAPAAMLRTQFGRRSESNYVNYASTEAEGMFLRLQTAGEEEYRTTVNSLTEHVAEAMPVFTLTEPHMTLAMHDRIDGVVLALDGILHYQTLYAMTADGDR